MPPRKVIKFSPGRVILVSLCAAVCCGTLLLLLPISRTTPIPIIDLLFTATSATCVTGLLTVPLSSFTLFGQGVILTLLQIGGLGLITMTIFVISIFVHLGLTTQLLAGQMLELESWKNIKELLYFIFKFTIALELLGAGITFFVLIGDYSIAKSIFLALFHSISSFCNAGFSLFPRGMVTYNTNNILLLTTSALMLFGGLGFITWHELFDYARNYIQRKKRFLSLYTKIVLITTSILIALTALLYGLLEYHNTLYTFNSFTALNNIVFNAIASRSTGYMSISPAELHIATLFVIMIIAFIGSSPGSTGSGIKTTTFAIFLATIRAAIHTGTSVHLKGRRIARDQVYKALAVITLSLAWIMLTTFLLLISEQGWEFFDIIFEVVSAFATLGISTGITPHLTPTGKILIMCTMIIGRIGSLTMIIALRKKHETPHEYEYPEERVMLG